MLAQHSSSGVGGLSLHQVGCATKRVDTLDLSVSLLGEDGGFWPLAVTDYN